MFESIEGFGRQLFLAIFLLACGVVSVQVGFGWKSTRGREAGVVFLLLLMVGLQYYFLLDVAVYLPSTRFYTYNTELVREVCKASSKGGKRPEGSSFHFDRNPCYCNSETAVCVNPATGSNVSYSSCTQGSSYQCLDVSTRVTINQFLDTERDCMGGMGKYCTQDEPCVPCDMESVVAFGSSRCRTCSSDYSGSCNFIEGVGPYCFAKPGSKKVVPCKKCCSEASPVVINGTCY